MRSGILTCWIVVALCACATAMERPAQISPGDILITACGEPNDVIGARDPNGTWDPAEHLVADWEYISVTMASSIYNPAVQPDAAAQGPDWSMSIVSVVDIVDGDGLIGWSTRPKSAEAFDESGNLVSSVTSSGSPVRWYQQPRSWSATDSTSALLSAVFRNRFSLSFPVDPETTYPAVFSRVNWSMNVLVAQEIKTVEIPFEVKNTWTEVTPGFEVMVVQADVEEGKYKYKLNAQYDSTQIDYLMGGSIHLWRDEALPSVAVIGLDVLNAEGQSIRSLDGGSFSSTASYAGTNGQMTGTATGSGSCSSCGTAATFRYTLAFDLYEQEANFVLENVPVPSF